MRTKWGKKGHERSKQGGQWSRSICLIAILTARTLRKGPGGGGVHRLWGVVWRPPTPQYILQTNNRAELTTCLEALRAVLLSQPLRIITDSKYVYDGGILHQYRDKVMRKYADTLEPNADAFIHQYGHFLHRGWLLQATPTTGAWLAKRPRKMGVHKATTLDGWYVSGLLLFPTKFWTCLHTFYKLWNRQGIGPKSWPRDWPRVRACCQCSEGHFQCCPSGTGCGQGYG